MEEMTKKLREDIWSGNYALGEYLPSELDLSATFQLSNNSVRKGLDVLVEEGLIEKIPRVGNRIKAPSDEKQTVIRFGYYPSLNSEAELSYLLSEFQRKHPHICVQTIKINDIRGYVRNLLKNEVIDVLTVTEYLYQELLESQSLELLEKQVPSEELYPFLIKSFTSGEVMYAQPFVYSPVILCYNREHFTKHQVPEPDSSWTWDELMQQSSKLAIKNERFGLFFHLFNPNRWIIFLLQSGAKFEKDRNGKYRVQGTKLLDGIEKVREMIYTSEVYPILLSASNVGAEKLFKDNQVSIILTTYLALNELKNAKLDFDVAPIPHLNEVTTPLVTIGLSVQKRSKVKAAAQQLVDYLVSEEAQQVIRKKTYSIPTHKQAAQLLGNNEIALPSRYQMYKEIMPSFGTFFDTNLSLTQLDDVFSECKLYWAGLQSKEKLAVSLENILNHKPQS